MSTEAKEMRLLGRAEIIEIATAITLQWVKQNANLSGYDAGNYFINVCRSLIRHACNHRLVGEIEN